MDSQQSRPRPSRRRGGAAQEPASPSGRYLRLRNPFEPLRVFSEDEVAHLHESALSILENDGMRVLLPEARRHFAQAGAAIDEAAQMVRLDRGLIARALSTAPARVEITAPIPSRNVTVGDRHLVVAPVSGPPNAGDLDRG
jgi:trimethylamine--corrinoid protein Co-methyltransferase